jgi:hypothetical protein
MTERVADVSVVILVPKRVRSVCDSSGDAPHGVADSLRPRKEVGWARGHKRTGGRRLGGLLEWACPHATRTRADPTGGRGPKTSWVSNGRPP